MKHPLISVLIPTKNRPEFIKKLLDCYRYFSKENNIEFIFHENLSDSSSLFNNLNKKVFRHIFISEDLSMSENFLGAISSAKGRYILMTGDDDFILPEIIKVAEFLEKSNTLAAVSPVVSYLWPGVSSRITGKNINGKSLYYPFNKKISYHKTSKGLEKILFYGGSFFSYEIPSLYQGIIKKDVILEIISEYGTCFPGFSPDLASAIAISSKVEKFVTWQKPFVVSGASIGSGSAEGYSHSHKGPLSDRKYIVDQIDFWPPRVPKFFSAQTIYSASTYISLNLFYPNKDYSINYEALYAGMLAFNLKDSLNLLKGYTNFSAWPKITFFLFLILLDRLNKLILNIIYNLILPKLKKGASINTPEKAFIEISKKYKML